jgi:ubiquinone/menaquinone biosynthesis C-methylase UbiE
MTTAIRCFFNDRAEAWDETNSTETVRSSERLIRSLRIDRGAKVLDIGCGTGIIIPWLLEAVGDQGRVTAIDIAEKMLRIARDKCERPNVEYIHANILNAPFLDHSFDEAVCHNCFLHLAEKERALREIFRILKPGGGVVICYTENRDAINRQHRHIAGEVGGVILPDEPVIRSMLSSAGFREISIRDGRESYLLRAYKPDREIRMVDKRTHGIFRGVGSGSQEGSLQ